MTLEPLLPHLGLNTAIEEAVTHQFAKNKKAIRAIAQTAYRGEGLDFPLCKCRPLTRLAAILDLLTEKYHAYKALGAADDIIWDTFQDVSLRAELYFQKTGKAGLSKDDVIWFRHLMQVNIFKIGALQYQPFQMIYLDMETVDEPYMVFSAEQKQALPDGAAVINCHIQKGADLRPEAVERSLKGAKAFFAEHFPQKRYQAFLCYSWLLYPPMVERLPAQSHIRQFAGRFSIIGSCPDPEQAMEFLFDGRKRNLPPAHTFLQRIAAGRPELLGYACGILTI